MSVPICPNPGVWHNVWMRLRSIADSRGITEAPPKPLVLAGWVYSNDLEKAARWKETVVWAERYGVPSEVRVPGNAMYCVDEPYGGAIGPDGGRMYLPWRTEPVPVPDASVVDSALSRLKAEWRSLQPRSVTTVSMPVHFTGRKRRRLLVQVMEQRHQPPWGTWTSLGPEPARRSFTVFRVAINGVISPHNVDHIDFLLTD